MFFCCIWNTSRRKSASLFFSHFSIGRSGRTEERYKDVLHCWPGWWPPLNWVYTLYTFLGCHWRCDGRVYKQPSEKETGTPPLREREHFANFYPIINAEWRRSFACRPIQYSTLNSLLKLFRGLSIFVISTTILHKSYFRDSGNNCH